MLWAKLLYMNMPCEPSQFAKVEVCAGDAQLSRAMKDCGLKTKSFDVALQRLS